MILVIGGAASGKYDYIRSLGYSPEQISEDISSKAPVMYALEKTVARDSEAAEALFETLLQKEIVCCCEVGAGVIPLEKNDRIFREACGRLCVRLAREAEKVVRLVSGIPVIIKEQE